jgi:hypothetical protein
MFSLGWAEWLATLYISPDVEVLNQFITYSFRATLLLSFGHWFSLGLNSRRSIRNNFALISFSLFTLIMQLIWLLVLGLYGTYEP